MSIALIIISVLLIALGLLQSGKSESSANILSGASAELFTNRKERGAELFISRLTMVLGLVFFVLSFLLSN